MTEEITLRPIADDDAELLCRIYGSTRSEENRSGSPPGSL